MEKPINEMTDRELDAAVAVEVMGWSDYRQGEDFDYLGDTTCRLWCPTWRHEDSMVVETEIERRGLVRKYLHALTNVIIDSPNSIHDCAADTATWWAIRRATSRQICEAALAAVRGAK